MVAITRTPTAFHIAAANVSGPPPAVVVNSPGTLRIPAMALTAYRNAERMMAAAYPGCGVSWNLLAGIGRIESMHANGGATDARGTAVRPIYGPALDGTLPGNEIIVQSRSAERVTYARAMGPMQFLPGTWSRYASDGDGDGKADVQNLFDSTLAAARYLCSGGLNLRDQSQVMAAILRYNNSMAYARNVLGWAGAYATGVVPVNLPPITGPVPPLGDAHLDKPGGPRTGPADQRHRTSAQRPTGADPAGRQAHRRRRPDPDGPARLRPRPDARPPARAAAGAAGAGPAAGAAAVDTAVVAAAAARLRGVLPGREHPGSGARRAAAGHRCTPGRTAGTGTATAVPAGAAAAVRTAAAAFRTAATAFRTTATAFRTAAAAFRSAATARAAAVGPAAGPRRLTAPHARGQDGPSSRPTLGGDVRISH